MLPDWVIKNKMSPVADPCVAIIGGGLTGLACSIGLTRHGIKHTIYESSDRLTESGFGVALSPNAIDALMEINPDLAASICQHTIQDFDSSHAWLTFRNGMASSTAQHTDLQPDFGSTICEVQASGSVATGRRSCRRWDLLHQLSNYVPKQNIKFNKTLVNLREQNGSVELVFSDGTTEDAAIVLGCDGIHSAVRRAISKDEGEHDPVFVGSYAFRGVIPMDLANAVLTPEIANKGNIFCGQDGYITTYPVDDFKNINFVAIHKSANVLVESSMSPDVCTIAERRDTFMGWGAPLLDLLNMLERQKWPLLESYPLPRYNKGLICLLGDAAHATTPHQGAGAGMGFEDACLMAHLLRARPRLNKHSLSVFSEMRLERTQRIITTSREAGTLFMLNDALTGNNFRMLSENLMTRHHWIWNNQMHRVLQEADLKTGLFLYASSYGNRNGHIKTLPHLKDPDRQRISRSVPPMGLESRITEETSEGSSDESTDMADVWQFI